MQNFSKQSRGFRSESLLNQPFDDLFDQVETSLNEVSYGGGKKDFFDVVLAAVFLFCGH